MASRRAVIAGGFALLGGRRAFAGEPASRFASPGVVDARQRLVAAYPRFLAGADDAGIVWRDGTVSLWDDGLPDKTFDQKLAHASLADQMSLSYRCGPVAGPPAFNEDPGRFRNIPFFEKMYGGDEASVHANLRLVPWRIGKYREALPFTRVNGVDRLAAQIVDELAALPEQFVSYLVPPAGSFNWRVIAGTNSLSAHAFGIAVDINAAASRYWRWDRGSGRSNPIPFEIVDIFERHGFIWGGKWYHYDTMHFEYRPELIVRGN